MWVRPSIMLAALTTRQRPKNADYNTVIFSSAMRYGKWVAVLEASHGEIVRSESDSRCRMGRLLPKRAY